MLPGLDFIAAWAVLTAVLLTARVPFQIGTLLAASILVALNWGAGLYPTAATNTRGGRIGLNRTTTLFGTTALFSWVAWLLSGTLLGSTDLSHLQGLTVWLWTFGAGLLNRRLARALEDSPATAERWLVVGEVDTAARIEGILARHVTARVAGSVPLPPQGTGLLGVRADVLALVEHYRADRVILAPRVAERETTLRLINTFKSVGVRVSLLPEPVELAGTAALTAREIAGVPLIDVGPLTTGLGPAQRYGSANGNGDGGLHSLQNGNGIHSGNGHWNGTGHLNGNGHNHGNGSHAADLGEAAASHDARKGANGHDRSFPLVSVIVPAMNEARNLPYVFARMPKDIHEVILVDGNSTDDTVDTARRLRPDVRVLAQPRWGKGDALRTAFAAVTGNIIVTLDADGSADPAEIPTFVEHLLAGADFAKGSRFLGAGGSADITRIRRLGNWGLSRTANILYGSRYTDLCYGYNAFWIHCLPCISLDVPGFEVETLMNLRIVSAGLKISEVPSYEAKRIHGVSNLNAVRDGSRVLQTIIKEWGRTQRLAS